jgi:hypothetical protein
MDSRKPIERMNAYLRGIRPREYIEFDRLVRLLLVWFDTHRVKDVDVFLAQEGKEYDALVRSLTDQLGYEPTIDPDLLQSLMRFAKETQ